MASRGSKSSSTSYRFVGQHAQEFFLSDGSCLWVGPGEYITLSDADLDDPSNAEFKDLLIDATGVVVAEAVAEAAPEPVATIVPAENGGEVKT